MTSKLPDFSHLTPDERIELVTRVWDSLPIASIGPDEAQVAELRRHRARLAADGNPGVPWRRALDDIRKAPIRRFPYVVYHVPLESAARSQL